MAQPHNITRMIAREQDLVDRVVDKKAEAVSSVRAKWFDADTFRSTNNKDADKEERERQDDLKIAAEQLTRVRRERLRELYREDMEAWQRELAMRGLALHTAATT